MSYQFILVASKHKFNADRVTRDQRGGKQVKRLARGEFKLKGPREVSYNERTMGTRRKGTKDKRDQEGMQNNE